MSAIGRKEPVGFRVSPPGGSAHHGVTFAATSVAAHETTLIQISRIVSFPKGFRNFDGPKV